MEKVNFKLITLARNYRGVSQTELSKMVDGLTQGNLSRMEKGILGITDEILEKISQALSFPKGFFYQPEPLFDKQNFDYRKKSTITKKKKLKLESTIDIVRLGIGHLVDKVELPELNIPTAYDDQSNTPKQFAEKVRETWGISFGKYHNFTTKIEANGIIVCYIPTSLDKFDGVATLLDDEVPMIFIRESMPNDRKIFTLAHEVGHVVMHLFNNSKNPKRDVEEEANSFASELLLPERECKEYLYNLSYRDLLKLKSKWGVSMQFILYKARELGCINDSRYKYLMIEMSRRGDRKKESINVALTKPTIIKQLVSLYEKELNFSELEMKKTTKLNSEFIQKYLHNNSPLLRVT